MKVRFGAFQVDSETRQSSGVNGDIHLSPKAFELLSVLVSARPRALSKGELQEHLWPVMSVTEANLPLLVSEVRAALGDAAHAPRYIRTVPRFGYAFCSAAFDAAARRRGNWEAGVFSLSVLNASLWVKGSRYLVEILRPM